MGTLFGSTTSARTGRLAALLLVPAVVVPASTTAASAAVGDALVVTNTVSATYDVDHAWQVFNAVDRNRASAAVGGTTATINYAVGVTALGSPARSGFEVRGTLGVTNPDEQALPVELSADLAGAGACAIAAADESPATGLQVTLPPGPSSFAYACAPGSVPADPATTTVTVSWQAPAVQDEAARAAGSSSAVAQAAYAVDQRTDELTTVTNSLDGATAVDLGTFDWDDVWAAPDHRVLVKVSSLALAAGDGVCADHVNLARESADATSDTETVTVCPAPEVLGEQSFGKAVGRIRVTCQGTVRAHLVNRSGRTVVYRLRVGTKVHKVAVKSLARKQVVTHGRPRAQVTLRADGARLDRLRIPQRCQAPGVLPDTGLRGTTR
ncbi:hypothetical protein [Nocardioides zhouii]|uniref:Uncharacterized protein n=1 Tax=Nocardioides zhouii TaxID=1168729 RepID=A0A4Q2SSE8_9ACTN|nr:hypothetical protein [Nocardioides zhouii]RYC07304.1 hypothetical protein EUA94_14540 [Nocardioides zhouii]